MTAYSKGAYYERRVRDWFRKQGWTVWRTPGSKSPSDLICARAGEWMLVQVQSDKYFPPIKVEMLKALCNILICRGMLVWRERKKIVSREVS